MSLRSPSERRRPAGGPGFTLVEMLLATVHTMILLLAAYAFIDSSKRQYAAVTNHVSAQATGRAVIEFFSAEARVAGYSPLGVVFDAIPQGTASSVRLLADLDGNGDLLGLNEDVTYQFSDPDGDSLFTLIRGVDLNGDGDFLDDGESANDVAEEVVQIDVDGDSWGDPFLSYDVSPPNTRCLRLVFGIRTERRDMVRKQVVVVDFYNEVLLRNRL